MCINVCASIYFSLVRPPSQELDDEALLARLRRVCGEKTAGGKCKVDEKVCELWLSWANERSQRIALAKTLATCDGDKKAFEKRVLKFYLYSDKEEHVVEKGWFSEDQLGKECNFSKHPGYNTTCCWRKPDLDWASATC